MGIPLLIIVGPTAIGKSQLALDLAIHFGGEIISGDSMQIYKGMNIGTAKLDNIKMHNIPHHLIDIKFPDDSYSVAEFQYMARKMIDDINSRSKLPIIAGGTGLYIQSVIDRYIFEEHKDFNIKNLRNELSRLADVQGVDALYNELLQIDPKSASKIHPNDKKEYFELLSTSILLGNAFPKRFRLLISLMRDIFQLSLVLICLNAKIFTSESTNASTKCLKAVYNKKLRLF